MTCVLERISKANENTTTERTYSASYFVQLLKNAFSQGQVAFTNDTLYTSTTLNLTSKFPTFEPNNQNVRLIVRASLI